MRFKRVAKIDAKLVKEVVQRPRRKLLNADLAGLR